jgi:hypothetical protein
LRGEYKQIEAETNKEKGLLKKQTFQIIDGYRNSSNSWLKIIITNLLKWPTDKTPMYHKVRLLVLA